MTGGKTLRLGDCKAIAFGLSARDLRDDIDAADAKGS